VKLTSLHDFEALAAIWYAGAPFLSLFNSVSYVAKMTAGSIVFGIVMGLGTTTFAAINIMVCFASFVMLASFHLHLSIRLIMFQLARRWRQ